MYINFIFLFTYKDLRTMYFLNRFTTISCIRGFTYSSDVIYMAVDFYIKQNI